MATCSFVFGAINADIPGMHAAGAVSEEETVAGASVATTAAATASQAWCEVSTDTACWVSFGTAPNAGTDNPRFLVTAGATKYYRVQSGWKAACIAA